MAIAEKINTINYQKWIVTFNEFEDLTGMNGCGLNYHYFCSFGK